ncbi:MAG: PD40 domain-containing protein [Phycisphaerae bacterium]|nr:PD40 domain-containing protein [Phycisphaerae bacterium]
MFNRRLWGDVVVGFVLVLSVSAVGGGTLIAAQVKPGAGSELGLKDVPYRIVYESLRTTGGKENWELMLVNADGSNPVNLTKTPDSSEMYPHASPDGTKICFVADETVRGRKIRSVCYMNIDGTGRVKVADNARQSCWSPDSKTIAYLPAEFERYTMKDYATKGIHFFDLETGKDTQHPNKNLHHLYNICWSFDGKWFLATVHGGMGFKHANLAIEAKGDGVYDLTKFGVTGCRPDFRYDNKKLTWGLTDWDLCVAEIDLSSGKPNVTNVRKLVKCDKEHEVYHSDFSPDGKYLAFSYGLKAQEQVGGKAPGWNICVSDMNGKWVQITTDGKGNKEPDWVPLP